MDSIPSVFTDKFDFVDNSVANLPTDFQNPSVIISDKDFTDGLFFVGNIITDGKQEFSDGNPYFLVVVSKLQAVAKIEGLNL